MLPFSITYLHFHFSLVKCLFTVFSHEFDLNKVHLLHATLLFIYIGWGKQTKNIIILLKKTSVTNIGNSMEGDILSKVVLTM